VCDLKKKKKEKKKKSKKHRENEIIKKIEIEEKKGEREISCFERWRSLL
jgi:hypothetical protein